MMASRLWLGVWCILTPDANLGPPPAHPAPQSLRRLFHDENSSEPDPFQSFAHQQPMTPSSGDGSGSIDQHSRFDSPPESHSESFEDTTGYDGSTIRQKRPSPLNLSVITDLNPKSSQLNSAMSDATLRDGSQAPTPLARPMTDDDLMPPPSLNRSLRPKMSYDALTSTPTSKTQPDMPRKDAPAGRRPGGSVGGGLRGFQFPLMPGAAGGAGAGSSPSPALGSATLERPVPLQRNHSAAPFVSQSTESANGGLPAPVRPAMMRQASVAVMENRSQAQQQALAVSQAQDDPSDVTRGLSLPRAPFAQGAGTTMMRSRSGSRTDSDAGVQMGLRDLIKVSLAQRSYTGAKETGPDHRYLRLCQIRTSCYRLLPAPRLTRNVSSPFHRPWAGL